MCEEFIFLTYDFSLGQTDGFPDFDATSFGEQLAVFNWKQIVDVQVNGNQPRIFI